MGVCRRGGAKVHSTNAVVLESLSGPDQPRDQDSDMGNKSNRYSPPPEKQSGKTGYLHKYVYV